MGIVAKYNSTKESIKSKRVTFNRIVIEILYRPTVFCLFDIFVFFFRLEMMFERAEQWSQDLEDNYEQLDKWKRKGDYLLYSMLPKSVADQLQNGQSTMDTCKVKIENCLQYPFF